MVDTIQPLREQLAAEPGTGIRSTLLLVLTDPKPNPTPIRPNPLLCPNCDKPTSSTRTPYCSDHCKEVSAFIRQFRSGLKTGQALAPERQLGMAQALWHILGGGYPERIKLIPESAIKKVIQRDGGTCQLCGKEATTVDHAKTACNRPINLRAVCATCSNAKPLHDPDVIHNARDLIQEIAARVAATQPVRICDDADTWDWRAYLKARSACL
jgi:5-methylcytosine-specific restriction endonuclease McrA